MHRRHRLRVGLVRQHRYAELGYHPPVRHRHHEGPADIAAEDARERRHLLDGGRDVLQPPRPLRRRRHRTDRVRKGLHGRYDEHGRRHQRDAQAVRLIRSRQRHCPADRHLAHRRQIEHRSR